MKRGSSRTFPWDLCEDFTGWRQQSAWPRVTQSYIFADVSEECPSPLQDTVSGFQGNESRLRCGSGGQAAAPVTFLMSSPSLWYSLSTVGVQVANTLSALMVCKLENEKIL